MKANRTFQCAGCGDPFTASHARKFCGTAVCNLTRTRRRKGHELTNAERNAVRRAEAKSRAVCEQCSTPFVRGISGTASGKANRWCSMTCRVAWCAHRRVPVFSAFSAGFCTACHLPFGRRRNDAADCGSARCVATVRHRIAGVVTQCSCGLTFCLLFGQHSMPSCPDCVKARIQRCRRVFRLRRKAAIRAVKVENVDPLEVLRRDKWTCQACGIATPSEKRGTYEPDAPEVDHVVPLARGGEHSYANTRCLCRSCNSTKCDLLDDEWMAGDSGVALTRRTATPQEPGGHDRNFLHSLRTPGAGPNFYGSDFEGGGL